MALEDRVARLEGTVAALQDALLAIVADMGVEVVVEGRDEPR